MMFFILNRIKTLLLLIVGVVRRALCCFRIRKRSYTDEADDSLTHIGIVPNHSEEGAISWDDKWVDKPMQPQTVQDHIQQYREKVAQANIPQNTVENQELDNLFQEMTPQYVKQKRILIGDPTNRNRSSGPDLSRLAVSNDMSAPADLGEWLEDSTSGWDEQHVDPSDILKEQRRLKRENKHHNMGLGRKLKA